MGAIQTRHHLLRWGKGVHEETTCLFAEWWVLSKYNSFDHFPKFLIESTGPAASCFISFSVFGYPDETLALVVDMTSQSRIISNR